MNLPRKRVASEILKRGYTDEEISHLYELGRLFLENGDVRKAEAIMAGLVEVAPDYAPAWIGMAYVHTHARDYEAAIQALRQALKVNPEMPEAMLFLVGSLLTTGDYSAAGTYLGELAEMIERGELDNPLLIRFFKTQLARFQSR